MPSGVAGPWRVSTSIRVGVARRPARPQLDRLKLDASKRSFDAVLVYKLDRFGRSVRNCLDGIEALRAHGVRFLAISQNIDTDETNPTPPDAPYPGSRGGIRAGTNPRAGLCWGEERRGTTTRTIAGGEYHDGSRKRMKAIVRRLRRLEDRLCPP